MNPETITDIVILIVAVATAAAITWAFAAPAFVF